MNSAHIIDFSDSVEDYDSIDDYDEDYDDINR